MKRKLNIISSSEVKKAGGLTAYLKKNGLPGTFSDKISGKIPLTKQETLDALKTLKD